MTRFMMDGKAEARMKQRGSDKKSNAGRHAFGLADMRDQDIFIQARCYCTNVKRILKVAIPVYSVKIELYVTDQSRSNMLDHSELYGRSWRVMDQTVIEAR